MRQNKEYRDKEKEIPLWVEPKEDYKFIFICATLFILVGLFLLGLIWVAKSCSGERNHKHNSYNSDKSSRSEIYDRNWNRKGYIKRDSTTWDTIYNKKNERIGYIKNGSIFDKDWNCKLNIK